MKEKALKQKSQKTSKDGLTYIKPESTKELYRSTRSEGISKDLGLVMCEKMIFFIRHVMDCPMRPYGNSTELWILLNYGPEQLKKHRDDMNSTVVWN